MNETTRQLEAILFVASEPIGISQLAELVGLTEEQATLALTQLAEELKHRGIRLTSHLGSYRLVTAPEASELVRRFMADTAKTELTRPALETLAIIAYRGPLTRSAIDELRGVSSETMIRNLIQRGLITEHGRSSEPGRPVLYAVSQAFLQEFGLGKLEELPPLEETA
jgi:segregation and condensation protein B